MRWWLVCALLFAPLSFAQSKLAALQEAGHLQIETKIDTQGKIVPGQRVILAIDVAVDTWFGGGTRIRLPEVPGLVIVQTEQFASNASERRGGRSWVVQRWHLDVYPQEAGSFTIPPLKLELDVVDTGGKHVTGSINTAETQLEVTLPVALEPIDNWVAAPQFSINQRFDKSPESLAVGDAIEQVITLRATDVLAMMLPEVSSPELPGLRAYPLPPKLENNSNRGNSSASRVQRVSFIAEQPGQYTLPGKEFYWWNTDSNKLEVVSTEAITITVTGTAAAADNKTWNWRLMVLALVAIVLAYGAWRVMKASLPAASSAARWLARQGRQLRTLFAPALPDRLNPGSNAEQRKASR